MRISDVLEQKAIIPNLLSRTKPDVIKELAEHLSSVHQNVNTERLIELVTEREALCSTAIDSGVAIPHAKLNGIHNIIAWCGRTREGVDFGSLDNGATHFFFLIVAPENSTALHIQLLVRVSKAFRSAELRSKLMKSDSADEILEAIISEDEKY